MEKQLEQVSLKEAANYLGVSEYHLRQELKLGKYPFGVCIEGEKRSEFTIYKEINSLWRGYGYKRKGCMISSVCDICSCCKRYRNSNCKGLLDWHKLDCKKGFRRCIRMAKMKRAEKLQIIENLTKGGLSTYEIAVRLGLSKCWIRHYKDVLRKAGRLPPLADNGERARLQKDWRTKL